MPSLTSLPRIAKERRAKLNTSPHPTGRPQQPEDLENRKQNDTSGCFFFVFFAFFFFLERKILLYVEITLLFLAGPKAGSLLHQASWLQRLECTNGVLKRLNSLTFNPPETSDHAGFHHTQLYSLVLSNGEWSFLQVMQCTSYKITPYGQGSSAQASLVSK